MARSDSYEELINNNLEQIESWVEGGDTDKDIAEKLGIGYSTYRKYKANSVALKGAIATGKDKANQEVEKSLLKICKGYKYYEEVATKVKTETKKPDGTVIVEEDVKISNVKKYKGPELAAQKFWLVNRKNKSWKNDPNLVENNKKLTKLKEKEVDSKTLL